MGFNQGQEQAILHREGPMLVLAGPGSGKTLVITHRAKSLIEDYGVDPSNILVITFTKAASTEMRERFDKLTEGANYQVTFGTFHAVFFKILKFAYHLSGNNILREEVKFSYLNEIIDNINLEIDDLSEFVTGIIGEISIVKGDMLNLEHYYSKNCSEEIFKKIFNRYQEKLEQANLIDFDDMLVKCFELLSVRTDILAMWQNKYQYILIDEFQDINKVQYEIIKMLAKPQDNIFIVGDDDQSIYRFRGAKPEIMLNFEKDYPSAVRVLLDVNYRSTKEVVSKALRVIKNNQKRFLKSIRTDNEQGDMAEILEFNEPKDENNYVIQKINDYISKGYYYSDIACLFRTNIGPRSLVEKLMEYNLPFRIKDNLPNMYEHWIAKDILTYINIARGSTARSDFLRIINKPKRYVSREVLHKSAVSIDDMREYYEDKNWMVQRMDQLEYDLGFIKDIAPYSAINYIRKGIGYDEYLEEYANYRRMKAEDLYELLDELMENSKLYKKYEEWFDHISEYGDKLKEQVKLRNSNTNSIEIATMHSAKGLEYKVVFILDANEGVTPHNKAMLDEDMEEERRLFYVAVTRAKEKLHIYSVKERYNKVLSTSRFVGEMLLDMDNIIEGTMIVHKKYGDGKIKKVADGKMNVYFPKIRKELTFDIKFAVSNKLISLKE